MFKRVLLKLSGEALASGGEGPFDDSAIRRVAAEIKEAMRRGTEISIVVGGGNFWRGRNTSEGMNRAKSDQIGMLSTVMNAIYLNDMFAAEGIKSVVMTPFTVGTFTVPFHQDLALEYLQKHWIVINAGGTGHPYLSTDTIAALRAAEIGADCILYAKNVDGVYDKNPSVYSDARKYKTISYEKVIRDDLEAADIAAMKISQISDVDSLVFDMNEPGNIVKACRDNEETYQIGTKVSTNIKEEYDE